jgi:hypothetical protein
LKIENHQMDKLAIILAVLIAIVYADNVVNSTTTTTTTILPSTALAMNESSSTQATPITQSPVPAVTTMQTTAHAANNSQSKHDAASSNRTQLKSDDICSCDLTVKIHFTHMIYGFISFDFISLCACSLMFAILIVVVISTTAAMH